MLVSVCDGAFGLAWRGARIPVLFVVMEEWVMMQAINVVSRVGWFREERGTCDLLIIRRQDALHLRYGG
jgi:hypothetical protein